VGDFHKLTDKDLPPINASLKKRKLDAIQVPGEDDWKKQHLGEGAAAKTATTRFREID